MLERHRNFTRTPTELHCTTEFQNNIKFQIKLKNLVINLPTFHIFGYGSITPQDTQ